MDYVAIVRQTWEDADKWYPGGFIRSRDGESHDEFYRRVSKIVDKMRQDRLPPVKGLFCAKTGLEIPPDQQRLRPRYGRLEFEIVNELT
jgi:hypothetical protein